MSDRVFPAQRETAQSAVRPAGVSATVTAEGAAEARLLAAAGGAQLNRYDQVAQTDVVAGRYGRGRYGGVRYWR